MRLCAPGGCKRLKLRVTSYLHKDLPYATTRGASKREEVLIIPRLVDVEDIKCFLVTEKR